eukprot:g3487.t1
MSSNSSSEEQTPDSGTSRGSEKRKRSESVSSDSTSNNAKRVLDLVYGKEAIGQVLLTGKDMISLTSVNKLILSILVESAFLPWAAIQGRPLMKKCVLIHLCGIDAELWEEKKSTSLKRICHIFDNPITTLANHATTKAVQAVSVLLSVQCKTKDKNREKRSFQSKSSQKQKQKSNKMTPCTFEDLVASMEQLKQFGFPSAEPPLNSTQFLMTPQEAPEQVTIAALDCEMCETARGSELTRMSLIDINGEVLVDTLVKPDYPITNYLTLYSGITPEMMKDVEVTLQNAQELFCKYISRDTILIGHSLENDLISLKIFHGKIVDTVMLYPHPGGFPRRSSLKYLAKRHLNRVIQHGSHDSVLDAQIALELARLKVENGLEYGLPVKGPRQLRNLTDVLSDEGLVSCLIDRTSILTRHANPQSHAISCTSDDEVRRKLIVQIKKPDLHFIWAQLQDLYRYWIACIPDEEESCVSQEKLDEILNTLDQTVEEVYNAASANTVILVSTGHGDTAMAIQMHYERARRMAGLEEHPWSNKDEAEWVRLSNRVSQGLIFATVKGS